jgi:hypothetical protein
MNVRLPLSDRIEAFGALGLILSFLEPEEKYELFRRAIIKTAGLARIQWILRSKV